MAMPPPAGTLLERTRGVPFGLSSTSSWPRTVSVKIIRPAPSKAMDSTQWWPDRNGTGVAVFAQFGIAWAAGAATASATSTAGRKRIRSGRMRIANQTGYRLAP